MKNRAAAAVVVLVGLVAAWLWLASEQTEDAKIQRRLGELTELVSDARAARGQAMIIRLGKLKRFFTEDVVVIVSDRIPEIRGQEALLGAAQVAMRAESGMNVAFKDVKVIVNPDGRHAQATVTVVMTGVSSDEARSISALELDMTKLDGEWLIRSVSPVEVMRLDR